MTGKTVVIHGAGMLGQTACAMAVVGGATNVIVLEPDPRRRENALRFGDTAVLDSASESAIKARVLELTSGRGADIGIELSGFPEAVERGLGLLRMGGRFVMAGATFPSRPFQWSAEQIVRRMLEIVGVYNYQPEDLETALAFLAKIQGRYPFDELVGKTFPLSEVNAAFEFAEKQRPARTAVVP
jgi:alcohol dehydrogenase